MNENKNRKWSENSFCIGLIDDKMIGYVQELGLIDEELSSNENEYLNSMDNFPALSNNNANGEYLKSIVDREMKRRRDVTLSQLWVLGCYEIIRTISQRINAVICFKKAEKEIRKAKDMFARLRMPLAKNEPASKYKETDYPFAYPGYTKTKGVAWQIADNTVLGRNKLSDCFMNMLVSITKYRSENI